MRTINLLLVAILVLGGATLAFADGHEAGEPDDILAAWIGAWKGSADMKESPFGPAGEMMWTEECSWFAGKPHHVVCHTEGTGPMGDTTGMGVLGFNAEKGHYTHFGIDSTGWMMQSTGKRSENTITFKSKESMGGQTFYSKFKLTMDSPTEMTFKWATSQDGENWTVLMTGKAQKQ